VVLKETSVALKDLMNESFED
jgi:dynein heavy chain